MNIKERAAAFEKLGLFLKDALNNEPAREGKMPVLSEKLTSLMDTVHIYNGWFTKKEVERAIRAIAVMLKKESLDKWLSGYKVDGIEVPKNIGVIMAGNIPMVGFHDFLCVLISGNKIIIKLSSDDNKLLPLIAEVLVNIEPRFEPYIYFAESKLERIDAVIATGSNNSSRYFNYYFSRYPNIIRKNRNSVAIITGDETREQMHELGKDVFSYYGLGCRNVSKLMVPAGYDFSNFFEPIFEYAYVMDNKKYANNYEYNRTVYLMNSMKLLDNNFLLLRENMGLSSPVGVLYFEYYPDKEQLKNKLRADLNNIQCMVAANTSVWEGAVAFGHSQTPALNDYADGVDVINFLINLGRQK